MRPGHECSCVQTACDLNFKMFFFPPQTDPLAFASILQWPLGRTEGMRYVGHRSFWGKRENVWPCVFLIFPLTRSPSYCFLRWQVGRTEGVRYVGHRSF